MASATFVPQHGMNSQTGAVQHLIRTAVGGLVSAPRRRKKKATAASAARGTKRKRAAASTSRSTRKRSKSPGRLVKGSKAAKAYMAKIRAKRK